MKKIILLSLLALATTAFAAEKFALVGSNGKMQSAFKHSVHVTDNGLECVYCHTGASKSLSGTDNLLPKWSVCSDCHSPGDVSNKGVHLGEKMDGFVYSDYSNYRPGFPHEKHIENAKLECTTCHVNLDDPPAEGKQHHFPAMPECIACHEQRNVSTECNTCHLPGENLKPENHLVMWDQRHGIEAESAGNNCVMCHVSGTKLDCQNCHQGDAILNPHPKDYMSRHGQDAHISDTRCAVCHEQRSFCLDCHRDMNVLPANHFRAGFLTATGGTHGDEAEYDLEACMSCHDTPNAEPTCARCHAK